MKNTHKKTIQSQQDSDDAKIMMDAVNDCRKVEPNKETLEAVKESSKLNKTGMVYHYD